MFRVMKHRLLTGLILSVFAALPASARDRAAGDAAEGADAFPRILAEAGGAVTDPALAGYVDALGRKLAAFSDQAGESWTFTILDTPVVNAFATPGGYVYVTRGLLALAKDEAELAAVLGHEISHVTAGHVAERRDAGTKAGIGVLIGAVLGGLADGTDGLKEGLQTGAKLALGYVAQHSQAQEYEADKLGIRLIAAAGYDPMAQADFLDALADQAALEAELRGRKYNPNRVSFFASHPATADRVRQAVREAQKQGIEINGGAPRGAAAYLTAIEGLVFGDSAEQGFVRGRDFSHPVIGFTFTVPEQFVIANSAAFVLAEGPGRATFRMDADRDDGIVLRRYIRRLWLPGIAQSVRLGEPGAIEDRVIGGLEAASVTVPGESRKGRISIRLTAIRYHGQIVRLTSVWPRDNLATGDALRAAENSFRQMEAAEIAALRPYRLELHTVAPGESANLLAASLPFGEDNAGFFRVLNGLEPGEDPAPGTRVKLIGE
jgi:predicted Zn-dependent protease